MPPGYAIFSCSVILGLRWPLEEYVLTSIFQLHKIQEILLEFTFGKIAMHREVVEAISSSHVK